NRPTNLAAFAEGDAPGHIGGPLVSVVMAARDAGATLATAAGSLLAQTWRNLEVIVVDDRSADDTAEVARGIAGRDGRLRLLTNIRAPGAYGARNTGLAAARGEFIALHDADDWAHPQRLERQMRAIGGKRGLTLCRHFRVDETGRPLCPRVFPFVRLSPITALARTAAFESLGPFDEVAVGADSEWLARFDARFGRRAAPRTGEVGMVALWASRSLSASPASGLTGEGVKARVAYVESWRRRHAVLE
ncbi:MAG: glycosyltransferase family 2 protein, partial [Caulobacteraceae bacterium]